jgi:hypothetical protein
VELKERVAIWISKGCNFNAALPLLEDAVENFYYRQTLINKHDVEAIRFEIIKASGLTKAEVKSIISLPEKDIKAAELKCAVQKSKTEKALSTDQGAKLREKFKFLGDKDCPDEYKILVSDMITAYHKYTEGHKQLRDCTTTEQCYETGKTIIENYLLNRLCWKEISHYETHRKILGEHDIFKEHRLMRELRAMDTKKLSYELLKTLPNRIWQNKTKIKEEPDSPYNDDRMDRIAEFEKRIEYVKIILSERK